MKLKSDQESEINGMGPEITAGDVETLLGKLDRLNEGDVLVLSGSIPASIDSRIYESILARLEGKGVAAVVAVLLLLLSLSLAAVIGRPALVWVLLAYLCINIMYSLWLKRKPLIDISIVAIGFVLGLLVDLADRYTVTSIVRVVWQV